MRRPSSCASSLSPWCFPVKAIRHSASPMKPMPSVPWLMTRSMVSFGLRFSHPDQRADISNGNCLASAVFWKLYLLQSCFAVISNSSSSFTKNCSILCDLSSMPMHSIAILTMFIVENDKLPRAIDVFSPKRFSKTRVLQPIVATSYW